MKNLSLVSTITTLFFAYNSPFALASRYQAQTPEGQYKLSVAINQALPPNSCTTENMDIAWQHQAAIRKMVNDNADLFPNVLPDGEVATANRMGHHWGYAPPITVALSEILATDKPIHLLEVGSCYGFDAIALIQRYPLLTVTCVETDFRHTDTMVGLMAKTLRQEQRERITIHTGDFLNKKEFGIHSNFSKQRIDVAVVSKVLHFYDDEDIFTFLGHIDTVLKPNGHVVMSHMSNHCNEVVRAATSICQGYMPVPETILPGLFCWGTIRWMYYFSQADMRRFAEKANLFVLTNVYVGTVHENSAASSSWLLRTNIKECILYTLLQKPGDID